MKTTLRDPITLGTIERLSPRARAAFGETVDSQVRNHRYSYDLFPDMKGQNPAFDFFAGITGEKVFFWYMISDNSASIYSLTFKQFSDVARRAQMLAEQSSASTENNDRAKCYHEALEKLRVIESRIAQRPTQQPSAKRAPKQ